MPRGRVKLVAFDLDGTLTRGPTICEALAHRLGRSQRMREIEQMRENAEIQAARYEMLRWYSGRSLASLCDDLPGVGLAPGAIEAFERLASNGIKTAIVSITWTFAVQWFAKRLGADAWTGTHVTEAGEIEHFWPEDKPIWLAAHAKTLGVDPSDIAAVGDSHGDAPMLKSVSYAVFVGADLPGDLGHAHHMPDANVLDVVGRLLR